MNERGSIFVEEAYALGKMLDHSSWQKGPRRLPRLITPSDVDVPNLTMFDNDGAIIWCEFKRGDQLKWNSLSQGQFRGYEVVARGSLNSVLVLCSHSVNGADGRQIDSRHDVQSFQVMLADNFGTVTRPIAIGNIRWQNFVFCWFASKTAPAIIRRAMFGRSATQELANIVTQIMGKENELSSRRSH